MYSHIISEKQGIVQLITIDREHKLNALETITPSWTKRHPTIGLGAT